MLDDWESRFARLEVADADNLAGQAHEFVHALKAGADEPAREMWQCAVEGLTWFQLGVTPTLHVTADRTAALMASDQDLRLAALRICQQRERMCALSWQPAELARWLALHELLHRPTDRAEAALVVTAARCWLGFFAGDSAPDVIGGLGKSALAYRNAPLVVEAKLLQALFYLTTGNLPDGLASARQGFRMAGTEGFVALERLAQLVLARTRRLTGRPHLASYILSSVVRDEGATWSGWCAWELLLAGQALQLAPAAGGTASCAAARMLGDVIAVARSGSRPEFDQRGADLLAELESLQPFAREAEDFLAALDPRRQGGPAVRSWRQGDVATLPWGLSDPGRHGAGGEAGGGTWALAWPGAPGTRILQTGLPLLGEECLRPEGAILASDHVRPCSALAILALAGPAGLDRETLFQRVYGFPFEAAAHGALLDVLLHRVRALLGSRGQVERSQGRIALFHADLLRIADPRSRPSVEARLIGRLSQAGTMTSEELAQTLQVPARSVREVLRLLVEEGTCRVRRRGKTFLYELEDTTFSDATPARR